MCKILAIFTCYNRKEITERCMQSLVQYNPNCQFTFVIADDNSTDGTAESLKALKKKHSIHLLIGAGDWFYSGGMRVAMEYTKDTFPQTDAFDYCLIVNDDVSFFEHAIEQLIAQSKSQQDAVIVGATQSTDQARTYSAIRYGKGIQYYHLSIEQWQQPADTFNANCVLLPYHVFLQVPSMDAHYRHSLGDYDYGLDVKRHGFTIYVSQQYVGVCDGNSTAGTWKDTTISRIERVKRKESVKGAPFKPWFYFLYKNFGVFTAVKYSITPYLRILMGK